MVLASEVRMQDPEPEDLNDGDSTFGIMTNEPSFDWQLQASGESPIKIGQRLPALPEAIQHLKWKEGLARTARSLLA